jgi:hypothetical protein
VTNPPKRKRVAQLGEAAAMLLRAHSIIVAQKRGWPDKGQCCVRAQLDVVATNVRQSSRDLLSVIAAEDPAIGELFEDRPND